MAPLPPTPASPISLPVPLSACPQLGSPCYVSPRLAKEGDRGRTTLGDGAARGAGVFLGPGRRLGPLGGRQAGGHGASPGEWLVPGRGKVCTQAWGWGGLSAPRQDPVAGVSRQPSCSVAACLSWRVCAKPRGAEHPQVPGDGILGSAQPLSCPASTPEFAYPCFCVREGGFLHKSVCLCAHPGVLTERACAYWWAPASWKCVLARLGACRRTRVFACACGSVQPHTRVCKLECTVPQRVFSIHDHSYFILFHGIQGIR